MALALTGCQVQTPPPSPQPPATMAIQPAHPPFAVIVPERLRNSDQFTVIGADWPPDSMITLELRQLSSADLLTINLGRVRADALGRFRFKGIVPPIATPGDWSLVAHGSDTAQIISTPFTVAGNSATMRPVTTGTATLLPGMTKTPPGTTVTSTPTVIATKPVIATRAATATKTPVVVTATPIVISAWRGTYFNNITLSGAPVLVRNDNAIGFDWGYGSPDPAVHPDNFSVRWTRQMTLDQGAYRITLRMDDAARVWVDGKVVLNAWRVGGLRRAATTITLKKGRHDVRVDYLERTGVAAIQFTMERVGVPGATPSPTATATASVTPTPSQTVTPTLTAVPLPTESTPTPQP